MKVRFKILVFTLVCIIAPGILFAFTVPTKPASFVSDYANVLKVEEKATIEAKLSNFEKETTNEIAVVIIPSLDGDTIENVAQSIFTAWGIGKKDKNNGALFLISIGDRKTRIHTGYGLEPTLTDIGTSYIQSEVVRPAFQAGDYAGGINGAVDKMIGLITGGESVPADYSPSKSGSNTSPSRFIDFAIFGLIVFQWVFAMLARSKSWWAGGVFGVIIGIILGFIFTLFVGVIMSIIFGALGLLIDYFVSKRYQKDNELGIKHPWFIGGSGFGRGGGGFGGFGGGSSGGGGSSSSW